MQFPISLSPWIEALKPVAQCGVDSTACSNTFWDSVKTNFLFVPHMPIATGQGFTWTVSRVVSGLFFPPMLLPSVEGVVRHTYRLVTCLGRSDETTKKAGGLVDGLKSIVGADSKTAAAKASFSLAKVVTSIGVNVAGLAMSSLFVIDTLSQRIMSTYPSAEEYSQSIFSLSKGAAGAACDAQSIASSATVGTGFSLFAKGMDYLGAGMYLWPLLKGFKEEGTDAVIGELPYYLTFAAWHDMLPKAFTIPVGIFGQSFGIFPGSDSHTVGRYLLLLAPLPIKYAMKGSWKMLTFWLHVPLISIPKMAFEEAKLCAFHGFAIWRIKLLKTSLLNGAVLADSIVRRGWSCAMLPQGA